MNEENLARCQEIVGYCFSNLGLLRQALTHASAACDRASSNERLEFLGDAVLGMVICEAVYLGEPELLEGEMTKIKSSVVSRQTCAWIADACGISELLHLGKGVGSSPELPSSVGGPGFEAVVGANYLDGGIDAARKFILEKMGGAIEAATASQHQRNYKSLLQQYAQRRWNATPQYDLLDEKGPEHAKCFEIAVRLNARRFPSAWGNSKKEAEQKAAQEALRRLGVLDEPEEAGEPPAGPD